MFLKTRELRALLSCATMNATNQSYYARELARREAIAVAVYEDCAAEGRAAEKRDRAARRKANLERNRANRRAANRAMAHGGKC